MSDDEPTHDWNSTTHLKDIARIERAVRLIVAPGAVTELRVLGVPKAATISGYFDAEHVPEMAVAAAELSGHAEGIYLTVNPVRRDLLARAANRTREWAKHTTSDVDVPERIWVPIDFDPVRPAGISSTNEEHDAAIERATACRQWLHKQGVLRHSTVLADSGNGAHLLVRVQFPNDDASRELVRGLLEVLDLRFSDVKVKVDQTTFNAARIFKLYGTFSCKGDDVLDRPHRMAKLLKWPAVAKPANRTVLEKIAAMVPPKPQAITPQVRQGYVGRSFDLPAWIAAHKLPVVAEKPWRDGHIWLLSPCPWSEQHTNNAAFIIRHANGAIAAGCHHNGCAGKGWHDLRDIYEPGWRERRRSGNSIVIPEGASPAMAREFQKAAKQSRMKGRA